jgi:two-component system response regulator YesN
MVMKMIQFLRMNRRSIVIPWLFSYAAIIMLPLALGYLVYRESSEALKGEIHRANDSLLRQVRESMDNQFQLMKQLNFELTWNVQVQELLYSNKYIRLPKEYPYDLFQTAKRLKEFSGAYPSVSLFYIYLNEDRKVLLPGTARSEETAYETLHRASSFSYGQWQAAVGRTTNGDFLPMTRIDEEGGSRKALAYVSAYPFENREPTATNVIMADQSKLVGAISNMEIFNNGYVLVLNKGRQVIVSSDDVELPADFPYERLGEGPANVFYTWLGERKYEVSSIESEHDGLTYVSLIPSSLYWEKAVHVRGLTVVSVGINLIGAGLLIYYFLRRNYHPVSRLVQLIADKTKIPGRKAYNEFQYLQHAFDNTLVEMDNIKSLLVQQQHILRSHFILRLLKGRLDHQVPLDESLSKFHMRLPSEDFAVLLFYVEQSERFFESLPSRDIGDKWRWLQFIITNVVEELASERNVGYVTEVNEAMACLVCFREEDEEGRQAELLRVASAAQRFLEEKYRIHLTVAVSGIRSGIAGISQAYLEALDAMEYKLVMGSKEIIAYEDVIAESSEKGRLGYYYPLQIKQKLINYVKVGEAERAVQTLDEIIERNAGSSLMSVPLAKCLMFNLLSTLIEAIDEIGIEEDHSLVRDPKWLERLTSCDTIQDMQLQLEQIFLQVCDYTAAKRRQDMQTSRLREVDQVVDRIKKLIGEQYRDPNLNISMIGDHFGRKATNLSKLFKDRTGEGLLDYINDVRVEQAKALLGDDKLTIYEVAGCVGYNDVNAFIRIFKKVEGITPGKYKEMNGRRA